MIFAPSFPSDSERQVLQLRGIRKTFGRVEVLRHVDLDLQVGEIVAVVGGNGSGKTTILKIISGALSPDCGVVRFKGREVTHSSPRDAIRRGVGMVYQDFALCPSLSVARNIFLGREPTKTLFGLFRAVDREALLSSTKKLLDELAPANVTPTLPVSSLSGGERQAVEIARAVSLNPELLLLDEPTSALSNESAQQVWRTLQRKKDEGVSILMTSHSEAELEALADRRLLLHEGELRECLESADDRRNE